MIDRPPIGQVIRAARLHLGHTQAKFAVLCNITPQYLSLLELGEVNVSLDTLLMISEALGEPLSSLLAKAEAMAASWETARSLGPARTGKLNATVPKQVGKKGTVSQKSPKADSPAGATKLSARATAPRSASHRIAAKAAQTTGQPVVTSGSSKTKRVTSTHDVPRKKRTKRQ
ncbi:helix-turn-helix domain-containing protein [Paraburkholderia caribensis]|uniref:helix-turn-helix domain-containing protein n=1 Tax=Paraburkholderia caribensis TaxID=75105 RepID=UPI0018D471AE|nr:helix-turn-helix transcriptional regulator [Paraburkholderia caribensis]